MALTDAACKQAQPRDKKYKLADSEGLYLEVRPTNAKYWFLKYRAGGKEKRISLGVYPGVTLKQARKLRDEAKLGLGQGIDPALARQEQKLKLKLSNATSFEGVARDWWEQWRDTKTEHHAKYVLKRLEADDGAWIPWHCFYYPA